GVSVVRSMASKDATEEMLGGSGRLSDIIVEYCPLVRPSGRSASSKRRASARAARCRWRHRHVSRTKSVVAKGTSPAFDPPQSCCYQPIMAMALRGGANGLDGQGGELAR